MIKLCIVNKNSEIFFGLLNDNKLVIDDVIKNNLWQILVECFATKEVNIRNWILDNYTVTDDMINKFYWSSILVNDLNAVLYLESRYKIPYKDHIALLKLYVKNNREDLVFELMSKYENGELESGETTTYMSDYLKNLALEYNNSNYIEWLRTNGTLTLDNNDAVTLIKHNSTDLLYLCKTDFVKKFNSCMLYACAQNKLNIAKWFHDNGAIFNGSKNDAFYSLCRTDYVDTIKWLYSMTEINVKVIHLRNACSKSPKIAKWLLSLRPFTNEELCNCVRYSLHDEELTKSLFNLITDIDYDTIKFSCDGLKDSPGSFNNESLIIYIKNVHIPKKDIKEIFSILCETENIDLVRYMSHKYSYLKYKFHNDGIKSLITSYEIEYENITFDDVCGICFNEPNCKTNCNHIFCTFCLNNWNKQCAICRGMVETVYMKQIS